MLFKSVIGQEELKQQLTQAVRDGHIAHAQLFLENEGNGALALALAMAQYINCPHRTDEDACGVCPSCNKMQKLIHPDLHFAVPVNATKEIPSEKKPVTDHFLRQWREAVLKNPYLTEQEWYKSLEIDNKQGNISVREATRIIERLNFKSFEAEYKVMIIWLPERMNEEASNRLLKLIEEPPAKTLFFLVSANPTRIIKTILSRTQPVRVLPIETAALVAAQNEQPLPFWEENEPPPSLSETQRQQLARSASGSYSRLLSLIEGYNESNEYFESFASLMRSAYSVDGLALLSWAEETAAQWKREKQKAFLHYAARLLRECFVCNSKATDVMYLLRDEESFVQKFAPFIHERNIFDINQAIDMAIAHLIQNGNAKIIFTDLALQFITWLKK